MISLRCVLPPCVHAVLAIYSLGFLHDLCLLLWLEQLTHAHRLTRHSRSTFTFTDQPWHVARCRNNDEKTSSPCTCFSLLFFFFIRLRDAEKHRLQVLVARFCLTISCTDALAIFLTTAVVYKRGCLGHPPRQPRWEPRKPNLKPPVLTSQLLTLGGHAS